MRNSTPIRFTLASILLLTVNASSRAYIEAPMTIGDVINQSQLVTILRVSRVDKSKNLIVYDKVEDIKGKFPTAIARHVITGQLREGEIKTVLDWAEPGKTAIFFAKDGACETCIDTYWYQTYKNGEDLYGMSHGEPFLLRSYAGKAERLAPLVRAMLEGKEVLVPAMEDNKDLLHRRAGKVWRLKSSLKIVTYDPKRDFAGWGGEDIRRIAGGTGFSHLGPLGKIDAEARSVSVIDFDGDGKLDICVVSTSSVRLFQNQGDSYSEVSLPGLRGGARAAAWGDHDGDGRPDLLLATAEGPKLYTNLGGGQFRDDTAMLPRACGAATAVAWIDADGDGKPDVLVATAFNGLRLYRNNRPADAAARLAPPKAGDWMLIGPFPNNNGAGFETVYPPEKEVDFAKQYDGKGGKVAWRKADFKDGAINNLAVFGKPELNNDAVCYVARVIEATAATELSLSLGSDDGLAVFVNGERVLAENAQRACAPDQNRVTIRLKPGKNNLVLKITQWAGEWAFCYSAGQPSVAAVGRFDDVSAAWGLGPDGLAGEARGETLAVADVNGDGRPDFLFGAGTGMLFVNTGRRFELVPDSGLSFDASKCGPTFVDFDGDGHPDLFVPQAGKCKLFRNDGMGHFTDVIDKCGDLAKSIPGATSAAWGDFNNDEHLDVVIGCLRGPNRYFQNNGDGTFTDKTAEIGLTMRVFNSQAVALADLNNDGKLDLVMANEGQESAVLFGNKELPNKASPLVVHVPVESVALGCTVRVTGKDVRHARAVSAGDGRGQPNLAPRFVLQPGTYQVEVRDSTGRAQTRDVTVAADPVKLRFDEKPTPPKK
ncbi:MAG TPA: VCBS repeat-containing protein [Gemmataceae bacterium]|nr:VCBS repeat-containing protein [Gemmataceae bacterium]